MIILDYKIKFIFILYIYILCVKIRVNPVLTRPLKNRVRVISCKTHLGRSIFYPNPFDPNPHELNPNPIDPTHLPGLIAYCAFFFLMKMVVGNYLSIDLSLTKDNKLVWLLEELKFIDLFSLKINWVKI